MNELSDEQKKMAIAELDGKSDQWVIVKHGLYYRPQAKGYTNKLEEAWIVSEQVADQHVYPHDEPVTKQRAPLPDYLNDRNAMTEAVIRILSKAPTEYAKQSYLLHLATECCGKLEWYDAVKDAFKFVNATARQQANALLRTMGKMT